MQTNLIRTFNINYLNSIPYRVLRGDPDLEYKEGLPVEAAAALLQKDVDLALMPLASVFKHGLYDILQFGIIADGAVESVFLLSELPLEDLEEISVDVSSETSVILLKTILAEFYPLVNSNLSFKVETPDRVISSIRGKTGGLIIGDDGLRSANRFPYAMDLGTEWKKQTGAPFLFAAWAHRPDALSIKQIENFNQNVEIGLKHRMLYARDWADTQGVNRDEAMRYVREVIAYPITPVVREAAAEFITRAAKHNLLPGELAASVLRVSPNLKGSLIANPSIVQEAINQRRLSIGSALQLVEELPLAKLAKLTSVARTNPDVALSPIFHLSLEDEGMLGAGVGKQKLLSPDQILQKLESVPEQSIVVVESLGFDELTLSYFQELISLINRTKQLKLSMLSVPELRRISSDLSLTVDEIVKELSASGLQFISGITEHLLCDHVRGKPLDFLKCQRSIAKSGLKTISNLRVSGDHSLLDYAIHLYQLRQLQDQTESIKGHFIDACPTNSRVYSEFSTPGHYFKVVCLARLILDNVPNIAISPKVFGRPVAEVLSALGPVQDQGDESILRII